MNIGVNVAVAVSVSMAITVQFDYVLVQAPLYPVNTALDGGVAITVTTVPRNKRRCAGTAAIFLVTGVVTQDETVLSVAGRGE